MKGIAARRAINNKGKTVGLLLRLCASIAGHGMVLILDSTVFVMTYII